MHEIITLDNSTQVVIERIPYVKSVAIGLWVGAGSCYETIDNSGVSHFIEHMLFKGTKNRTARQIAECIDDIGGQINAYTSKEATCFYAKSLSSHLDISIDLLSDMLFNSRFDPKDIETEKSVIEEEISMYEDAPEELIYDLLHETAWKGSSIGNSILGTRSSLAALDRDKINIYMNSYYTPNNMVISVVGDINRNDIIDRLNRAFGSWTSPNAKRTSLEKPTFISNNAFLKKDIEQAHLCIGYDGLERGHEGIYDLLVVNSVLGGNMSSRLFQKVREEKGLAYSIYSFNSSFNNCGIFGIYAGINPANVQQVTEIIKGELSTLVMHGLTNDEISKTREQIKSSMILGLESTTGRMHSYGKSLLHRDKILTMDQMIEKLDRVNISTVEKVINQVFSGECTTALIVNN